MVKAGGGAVDDVASGERPTPGIEMTPPSNAAGARGRRGGNEWVTRGPHMSLRCRPASYVAVNASVAWSNPFHAGQSSLFRDEVLKLNDFDS